MGPHGSLEQVIAGFKQALADKGFVDGKDVVYEYSHGNFDPNLVPQVLTKLEAGKPRCAAHHHDADDSSRGQDRARPVDPDRVRAGYRSGRGRPRAGLGSRLGAFRRRLQPAIDGSGAGLRKASCSAT